MREYTVLDFILTSEDGNGDFLKIDALRFDPDEVDLKDCDVLKVAKRFTTLVNPCRAFAKSKYYKYLKDVSSEDLKKAPCISEAIRQLKEFSTGTQIVEFDWGYSYLSNIANECGIPLSPGACNIALDLTEQFGDAKRRINLPQISEYLGLDCGKPNVVLAAEVFMELLKTENGISSKMCAVENVYFTPLYQSILSDCKMRHKPAGIEAVREIRLLQQAHLGEAFMLFVNILNALDANGVEYKLNGSTNMSKLAFCAGITKIQVPHPDYYVSLFVNPYYSRKYSAPHLYVNVVIEPQFEQKAMQIINDRISNIHTDRTIILIRPTDTDEVKKYHSVAERWNKSVLDITLQPSDEFARYTTLKKSVTKAPEVKDEEVLSYIQTSPIRVFDNADKYLRVLSELKPQNIQSVTHAMAIADFDREDILHNIVRLRNGEQASRFKEIAKVLSCSGDELLYQEQAIQILCDLSGCSQFYAYNIRNAIIKHKDKETEQYRRAFLLGGEDVDGIRFNGCISSIGLRAGSKVWNEICNVMPKLYLKAHAQMRAEHFIECAKLQLQCEKA